MPKEIIELTDLYDTVTRPVNITIAKQIAERIGFDPSIMPEFANTAGTFGVRGSNMETDSTSNIWQGTSRSLIEVTESYVDRGLMTNNMLQTEWPAIFTDPKLDVYLSPHYRKVEVSVRMIVKERDQSRANAMHAAIKSRIDQTVFNTNHSVKYNYNIPPVVVAILLDIYRLRENVAGYGQNSAEWFNEAFSKNWRITTAQNGMGSTITLGEGQLRISGWFDGDPEPPQWEMYGDKEGAWSTEVNYKFWYDRPEALIFKYPLIVHNQLISKDYIDFTVPDWFQYVGARQSRSETILQEFTPQFGYEGSWLTTPGIPIPVWDEWLEPKPVHVPYYMSLFRFMATLDNSDPDNVDYHSLINFERDIKPDWDIWPEAIGYMKDTAAKMTQPYRNVFIFQVYEWDRLRDMSLTHVDSDLNVTYDEALSLRDNYHVNVSFLTDPSMLTRDAIIDLANHWCFGYKYFQVVWPKIVKLYPAPDSTCMTSPETIYQIIEDMKKDLDLYSPPPISKLPTVASFVIIANRRN